jgi:predicted nucleic acid-binding protein
VKYMLDTNICIYLLKRISKVAAAFSAKKDEGAVISSITLAELEYGRARLTIQTETR